MKITDAKFFDWTDMVIEQRLIEGKQTVLILKRYKRFTAKRKSYNALRVAMS